MILPQDKFWEVIFGRKQARFEWSHYSQEQCQCADDAARVAGVVEVTLFRVRGGCVDDDPPANEELSGAKTHIHQNSTDKLRQMTRNFKQQEKRQKYVRTCCWKIQKRQVSRSNLGAGIEIRFLRNMNLGFYLLVEAHKGH